MSILFLSVHSTVRLNFLILIQSLKKDSMYHVVGNYYSYWAANHRWAIMSTMLIQTDPWSTSSMPMTAFMPYFSVLNPTTSEHCCFIANKGNYYRIWSWLTYLLLTNQTFAATVLQLQCLCLHDLNTVTYCRSCDHPPYTNIECPTATVAHFLVVNFPRVHPYAALVWILFLWQFILSFCGIHKIGLWQRYQCNALCRQIGRNCFGCIA